MTSREIQPVFLVSLLFRNLFHRILEALVGTTEVKSYTHTHAPTHTPEEVIPTTVLCCEFYGFCLFKMYKLRKVTRTLLSSARPCIWLLVACKETAKNISISFNSKMAAGTASFYNAVFCRDSGTWYPLSKHLAFAGLL